jgi:hypothetical protein
MDAMKVDYHGEEDFRPIKKEEPIATPTEPTVTE